MKLEYSSAGFTALGEPKLRDVTGRWLGKLEYSSAGFTALGEPKLRDVTGRRLGDGVGGVGLIYS